MSTHRRTGVRICMHACGDGGVSRYFPSRRPAHIAYRIELVSKQRMNYNCFELTPKLCEDIGGGDGVQRLAGGVGGLGRSKRKREIEREERGRLWLTSS